LAIAESPRRLEVRPIDYPTYRLLRATRSSDGRHTLEAGLEGFVVRAAPSGRVVTEGPGAHARWISASEIAFLDPTSAARRVTKLDVTAPAKSTPGGPACSGGISCERDEPPVLVWASSDLAHALVAHRLSHEIFDVEPTGSVRIADPEAEPGTEALATGFGDEGACCMLFGPRTRADATSAASTTQLHCAAPPWRTWRRVRDFEVTGPLDRFGSGSAHLHFFSDREVLVSLPSSKDVIEGHAMTYEHCLVTLDSARARCTSAPRPEWAPLGDGRWVIQAARVRLGVPRLIDVSRGRSWAIGTDTGAVWWGPARNAHDPAAIVLERLDKADVQAGTLALPVLPEP
jgi:hypothetical protein